MPLTGERLLIAATVDPVETGDEFLRLPAHMSIVGWFSFSDERKLFLFNAMGRLFDETGVYQDAIGTKKRLYGPDNDILVREMGNVDTAPWFGLHALIKSLGTFPEDDPFVDVFSPHVSATSDRMIKRKEELDFSTVALFSKNPGDTYNHVDAAYTLMPKDQPHG